MNTNTADKCRAELNAASEEQAKLEAAHGIRDAAEEIRALRDWQEQDTRLRALYFGVADISARMRLIALERRTDALAQLLLSHDESNAKAAVEKARSESQSWYLWAAAEAIALVAVGYWLFSLAGALAGAVAGYFLGRGIEQNAERSREKAVLDAERELREAEEVAEKSRNTPDAFSLREQMTGEPDGKEDSGPVAF